MEGSNKFGIAMNRLLKKVQDLLDWKWTIPLLVLFSYLVGLLAILIGKYQLTLINFILFLFYFIFSSGKKNLKLLIISMVPAPSFLPNGLPLTSPTLLFMAYAVIVLARALIKAKREDWDFLFSQRIIKPLALGLIFCVYSIICSLACSGLDNIITAISFCLYTALPILILLDFKSEKDFAGCAEAFIYMHCASLLSGLPCLIIDPLYQNYLPIVDPGSRPKGPFRFFVDRYSGFDIDQNELSVLSVISICLLFFNLPSFKKKTLPLLAGVLTVGLTFLAQSKTYLIIIVIIFLITLLRLFAKKKSYAVIGTAGVCFAAGFFIVIFGSEFLSKIMVRFFENLSYYNGNMINSITSGRVDIWLSYLRYLGENPLILIFGQGPRATYNTSPFVVVHNNILNLIFDFGIVGLILLIFYCAAAFQSFKTTSNYRLRLSEFLPLIVYLFFTLSLTITGSTQMQIIFAFTCLLIREASQKEPVTERQLVVV